MALEAEVGKKIWTLEENLLTLLLSVECERSWTRYNTDQESQTKNKGDD